ncbi:MAG TPA: DUF6754 domain-containing protein [candidate division Zixibacteria bacterium]|nr:DUF6754 domain-containing protein [candidate division Zixibacteria bacterium]
MNGKVAYCAIVLIFLLAASAAGQELLPPLDVRTKDAPNDKGTSLLVIWKPSFSDTKGDKAVEGYQILRGTSPDGAFEPVGTAAKGDTLFTDHVPENGMDYYYRVQALGPDGAFAESETGGPAQSSAQWFNTERGNALLAVIILVSAIIYFVYKAQSGRELYIRKIAGLEEVDNAVGRATEMGKKIVYIPGRQDMDNVQTIAAVLLLGRVARLAAEYETRLEVPNTRSMVMVSCREVVKEAFLKAGRPDAYREDDIHYITEDQFGFAAAVDGMMLRDRPAAVFYQGAFFAESLIFAETGNSIGAIQIAGTAQPAQLPFFVVACDYTLIGEELFAASAYLSKEPRLLGSLKGQDVGKFVTMAAISIGALLATLKSAGLFPADWVTTYTNFFLVR